MHVAVLGHHNVVVQIVVSLQFGHRDPQLEVRVVRVLQLLLALSMPHVRRLQLHWGRLSPDASVPQLLLQQFCASGLPIGPCCIVVLIMHVYLLFD